MAGKRHHFVPQFLQRGFASHNSSKDYYTWVYRRGDLNPFNTNIKNVGLEGYFYSEDKESTLDDIITDAETEYAIFVDRLRINDGFKKIDNKKAAHLIAHLEIRTKNIRDSLKNTGTLLLEEMTNFLQDELNCKNFVKKQVASETLRLVEEEFKKRNIPKTLFPIYKPKIARLINEKTPEMTTNMQGMMMYISQNLTKLMEQSAKNGHIKALLNSHTPPTKVSLYEKLSYNVIDSGDIDIPLGDSCVVFNVEDEECFKPFCDKENKLLAVVLPISSSKLLIGSTKDYSIDICKVSEAIVACSLDYFISRENRPENIKLAEHIAELAKIVSDEEIEDILSNFLEELQRE